MDRLLLPSPSSGAGIGELGFRALWLLCPNLSHLEPQLLFETAVPDSLVVSHPGQCGKAGAVLLEVPLCFLSSAF